MQVKFKNPYDWGIQWNSMVMQVKKTYQRKGSGERAELQTDGMYQVQASQHHRRISYISTVRTWWVSGWTSERRQICPWWHCTVLFYKRDQYLVLFYTSNPSRGVNTNCQSPTLFSSIYGLLGSYAVSAELHGVTLKDRNLSADHLEQFHTHSSDQHLHRQNHVVPSELPGHCSVKFNKR